MNEKTIESYIETSKHEVVNLMDQMDIAKLDAAKQMILEAKVNYGRVHVSGIGKPSYVAGYIASLLSSTGTPSYVLDGTEAIHGSSGQVVAGDVVIAISNSGETKELKHSIITVKKNGAKVIAVTGNEASWLAKYADISLFAGVHEEGDTLNKPPRSSILAEMIVLQCLSVMLQNDRHLTKEEYVLWHPGGALGKSILMDQE